MKKLDKYMLIAFAGPFIAILLIVVFALLMQFLWVYIDELVGKGLSFKIIMEFLGWGAAIMLPLSLPLATVLASMMTMGNLAENSELIALKSAGISLARVMAPLIITCFFLAIGAFFVANNLVPMAYNNIFTLREDIGKTKEEIKIPSKTFYDGIDGYILRVEENDRKTGMMHGVMVYNHTANNGNISVALADSAIMKMSEDKNFLTFTMYNGISYEENNDYNAADSTRQVQRTEFSCQKLIIPIEHYEFQKTEVGHYSDQAKSMSLKDLVNDQDSIRLTLTNSRMAQMAELRSSTSPRYNLQLDTSRFGGRSMFPLGEIQELSLEDRIAAHTSASNKLNTYISIISGYDRETAFPALTLNLINIEIYKKFSIALICFLLFFIGAPLGAIIRKGGLGVPAIASVLFFVLYYIIDIIGNKLARDGSVDAMTGAFIASYVLIPFGAFFTYKAINDESILGTDNIRNAWKKIKTKFMEIFKKTNIIYMGTPEFAVAPLKALLESGYNVVAVVTVPDKPSGRGQNVNESAVKKYAVSQGLPVLQPSDLRDTQFIEQLKSFKPDLFAVVAFRLLPREVFTIPRLGTFNLHAALLPQYRGAAPINWAVINGEKATGVTSFLIDDGVDTGTILIRDQYVIKEEDNASSVHDVLMEMGSRVVVQTVEGLMEGNIDSRVQQSFIQGEEILHKAPKISRELCHVDWHDSTDRIVNLIRGLSDYPGAFTDLVAPDGTATQLKIFRARRYKGPLDDGLPAGAVFSDGKTFLAIASGNGAVAIEELQLSGKKRMSVEDFLRGFHYAEGYSTSQGTSSEVISQVRESERQQLLKGKKR